ncbi:MAG: hypothetical protein AAF074_02540 [Pseudomonadota bacterium]
MVDIISKRSGPRAEDQRARALIEKNRATITKLADQFSNGAYSASREAAAAPAEPQASGLIVSDLGAGRKAETPRPYIRISPNRRVVMVDMETNRQMHHLGEIRRVGGQPCFVLATKENGFFSPLDAALAERLAPLDGAALGRERSEAALAEEIGGLLDLD